MRRLVAVLVVALGLVVAPPAGADDLDQVLADPGYTEEHAAVLRLYRAFFEREPDAEGAWYWIGVSDEGASLDDIAWAFAASAEFTARYGSELTDSEFLRIVYGNVLGRTPDQEGFDYWLGQMADGLARPELVRWVTANAEFVDRYPYGAIEPATLDGLAGALLAPGDLPGSGWSYGEARGTTTELGVWGSCRDVLGTGGAALHSKLETAEAGVWHYLVRFSTDSEAAAYLDRVAQAHVECADFFDTSGNPRSVSLLSTPAVGDGGWVFTVPQSNREPRFAQHLAVSSRGRVVQIVFWIDLDEQLQSADTEAVLRAGDTKLAAAVG